MAASDHEAAFRYVTEEMVNRGNLAMLNQAFTADYLARNQDRIRETITGFRAAFPDWHVTIDEVTSSGDVLVFRSTGRGTDRITGKEAVVPQFGMVQFEGDKVSQSWGSEDPQEIPDEAEVQGFLASSLPAQLGRTPLPAQLGRTLTPG